MKKILLLFILFYNYCFAQKVHTSFLYPFELKADQKKSFDSIKAIWNETVYVPFSKKNKIDTRDCYKCGAFYMEVNFVIDKEGKLTYSIGTAKQCLKNMPLKTKNLLIQYFLKIVFPYNLKNLKIMDRLGLLAKC
jgi:hypothetical protein